MKKFLYIILSASLVFSAFVAPVHAVDDGMKTIELYDYYDSENLTADLYFQNEVPYIAPDALASMTEYQYSEQDGKIIFEKREGSRIAKRVSLNGGKIRYGTYKDDVESIDVDGKTYIELAPSIDYLDSRLKMSPDGRLLLFSSNLTFSQLVSQVNYDLLHGGNIEDYADGLQTGAAWLWLLLNGKILSSLPDERSRRLAYGILTEENPDDFIIQSQSALVDYASTVSDKTDLSSAAGELTDLEIFDSSINELGKNLKSFSKFVNYTYDALSRVVNLQMQVEQLYLRNIENTENTLLNEEMNILTSSDYLYKNLNKITKRYNKNSQSMSEEALMSLYADEGFSFAMNMTEDIVSSLLTKAIPALDAGLSLIKVYGNISGVTDVASATIEQKDYSSLQSKVAIELQDRHDQIKKGHTFSKDEILEYVELARMYYHVKTAYYHMCNENVPDPLFEDGYQMYLDIEKSIDQYGHNIYTLDLPEIAPTEIGKLTFPEKQISDMSIAQISGNHIYLKYIDTEITIPDMFVYSSEGFSTQAPQYNMVFELDPNHALAKGYTGILSIDCWSVYANPESQQAFLELKKPLSEAKKDQVYMTKYGKFWGTENKYIELSHFGVDDMDRFPGFTVSFVDMNDDNSVYSIYISLSSASGVSDIMEKNQFESIHQELCNMIETCTFL